MKPLVYGLALLASLMAAAACGQAQTVTYPGGTPAYRPPVVIPQTGTVGNGLSTDLKPNLEPSLGNVQSAPPVHVVGPPPPAAEASADGGDDCSCRCPDSSCADTNSNICSGPYKADGTREDFACQE